MMRFLAEQTAEVVASTGLLRVLEQAEQGSKRIRILAYHRVDEFDSQPDLDPGLISATPSAFRLQLEVLSRAYSPISIADLIAAHRGETTLPPRAVLLTFDDGYSDFATHAWPILKEFEIPATLFVPTSFPDAGGPGFWWDRLHSALSRTDVPEIDIPPLGTFDLRSSKKRRLAHRVIRTHAKTLPHAEAMNWLDEQMARLADIPDVNRILGWDALRTLAKDGLSICSHGSLHAICTRLSKAELIDDLSKSRARIEMELGEYSPPPVAAYPSGTCDVEVIEAAREAGYELAFGGLRGINRMPLSNPLNLMRLPVHRYAPGLFRAQLRPGVTALGRLFDAQRMRIRS